MKKSKVNAIIRKKVAQATIEGERQGYNRGLDEGKRKERELQTLLLTPDDASAILGQVPPCQYVNVALSGHESIALDPRSDECRMYQPRIARFRAIRESWATHNGPSVSWYRWQFEGLS